MDISIKEAYDAIEQVKILFTEYQQGLGIDLTYQNYKEEFDHLPGKYAPPDGRLYIAYVDGRAAGCIGIRRFDRQRCEMKRTYIRKAFRGLKIGRLLVEQVIVEARRIGYDSMLLDTLATMESALMLYKKLGFVEIEPYYNSPIVGTKYLGFVL